MKFVLRFLELLAATAISYVALIIVLDHSVLSPTTILSVADKSGVYTDIAHAVPATVQGYSPAETADLKVILDSLVTPEYIKAQMTGIVNQVTASIRTGAPLPTISFANLLQNASEQGFVVPPDELQWFESSTQLDKSPQMVALVRTSRSADSLMPKAAIAAVILLAAIALLAGAHRYGALAKTSLQAAVGVAIWVGVTYLVISLSVSTLGASEQLKTVATPMGLLSGGLVMSIARAALWPIGILIGMAIVLFVMQMVLGRKKPHGGALEAPMTTQIPRQRTDRMN